jgi:hypothetical protein
MRVWEPKSQSLQGFSRPSSSAGQSRRLVSVRSSVRSRPRALTKPQVRGYFLAGGRSCVTSPWAIRARLIARCPLSRRLAGPVQRFGEVFLQARQEVTVAIEGNGDRAVAHPFHDRVGVGAFGDEEPRLRVPVMEIPQLMSDDRGVLIRGACMARAKRLLSAMIALHDAGLVDVVTIPLRPIVEQWLVSLRVRVRPATAVPLLNGEYEKSIEKINRLADLRFDPALYDPGTDLPSWETLAQWVGDDLEAQGRPRPCSACRCTWPPPRRPPSPIRPTTQHDRAVRPGH